uniref:oxygenase MpaB family protein n=1 Tax=Oleiagrimonas sp. TaxID=2010330 RepID=UPI0026032727
HRHIRGYTADGQPYAADDPALLTWVHVTEAFAFLQGFRRYAHCKLPARDADRYYNEVRRIAVALGARDVPGSERAVGDYLRDRQDELRFDDRSREVLRVLSGIRLPVPAAGLSRELFLHAGAALLPPWARRMMRRTPMHLAKANVASHTLAAVAPLFRSALQNGIAAQSCARMARKPDLLRDFEMVARSG